MKDTTVSRRDFLRMAAFTSVVPILGCGGLIIEEEGERQGESGGSNTAPRGRGRVVYRRSGRGRHVSRAAKRHNANMLYIDEATAAADLAHSGDNSVPVPVTISLLRFNQLFGKDNAKADLR